MNRRQRDALARRARDETGPRFQSSVTCVECGEEATATYRKPPLAFVCPGCGRRAALRDDDQPYPPAAGGLPT
jgi:ribosomal protein S27E